MHNAIKKLMNGKAVGLDKIQTTIIKDEGDLITKPLTMVCNSSLTNEVFHDSWKIARITPTLKSGTKKDVNNYRPISVILVFSRILEGMVHDQLCEFQKANEVITRNQLAFQKLYTTVTFQICSRDCWYEHRYRYIQIYHSAKSQYD